MSKLAEITCKVEAAAAVAKRTKRDHGYPILNAIVKKLLEIRSAAISESKNALDKETFFKEVEVEIRVGMIIEGSHRWKPRQHGREVQLVDELNRNEFKLHFKAGIDETFCNKLKKKLKSSGELKIVKKPLQIIRYDNNRTRWEVDGSGRVIGVSLERKNYFSRHDVAMLSFDYDIRIDGATEKRLPQDAPSLKLSDLNRNWISERRKQRFTYLAAKGPPEPWKLDLTYVESRENSFPPILTKDIELEFELDDTIKNLWLGEENEEKFKSLTGYLGQKVLCLIDACIPCMQEEASSESLQPLRGGEYSKLIHQLNSKILGNPQVDQSNRLDFIGSMPVNLTRQNLQIIQSNDYFMTEKSDGVRYLLYVIAEPSDDGKLIAVLLDRSKNVFSFRGSSAVGAALGVGTVLDGELVFNLKFNEHAFLVFDALLWKEQSLLERPFKQRLDLLQREILHLYSSNITRTLGSSIATVKPINLVRKVFVHKSEGLQILLGKIRLQANGDRIFVDTDRRVHRTDGIIFQPNGPYQICRHPGLMKWKWADLRSVDLQVSVHHDGRSLVLTGLNCSGPENSLIKCGSIGGTAREVGVSIGAFDSYRLLAEIQEYLLPGRHSVVVEVAYDVTVGMWSYIHHRKDKAAPNYIDTVLGVFVEQAECITEEELEFSLTASMGDSSADSEADFQSLMAQYAKSLVQNQRARKP